MHFEGLGASSFQIGLIQTVFWAGILLFSPFWGSLADLKGDGKKILLTTSIIAILLLPLLGLSENIWKMLLLLFLISSLTSSFQPIALALASERSSKKERGYNMSIYSSSRGLGITIGRISAGLLLSYLIFKDIFLIYTIIGILAVLCIIKLPKKNGVNHSENNILKESFKKILPTKLGELWTKNGHKYLLSAIFLRKLAMTGVDSMLAVFIVSNRGLTATQMGLITGIGPGLQIVFMILFGKTVDRVGRKEIYSFGFLLCSIVPIIYATSTTFNGFILGSIILGISFSAVTTGTTAFIGDITPNKRQGELLGVRKTVQGLAGVIGGLLGGVLTFLVGFESMFFIMSLLMIIGAFVAYYNTKKTLKH